MKKVITKALASSFDDKEYTLRCVMTAEVTDRHGEVVDVETMSTDNFVLNPVVLPFHDYSAPSLGKVIEIVKTVGDDGVKVMECVIKFAVDEYEVAKTHWLLYKGGFMSAFSIGFRVGAVKTDVDTGVTRLMDCELLEISCVSVPANQLALAKSKGLDITPFIKAVPEKAMRDLLIEIKDALGDKEIIPAKTEKELDKKEVPATLDKEKLAKQRVKKALEQAIRQLVKA